MYSENRLRGILWMLATMACFIALDTVMKLGMERFSLVQVTWARFFFATLFSAALCGSELFRLIRTNSPVAQSLRSVFLMVTTGLFNAGIAHVALPTATTIMFMTPIITTLLSVVVLGEFVGLRRWTGIAVGFVGALIVVQPWELGTDAFSVGSVLLLAAAFTNAGYQIATRQVRGDDPKTSLLITAAFGAVITTLILPWHWTRPDVAGWTLLVVSGLLGMIGHLCIIEAFRNAPASVVAPFSYSSLLWATLSGFAIWGDVPQQHVLLGAALIIASGLYIFWRERLLSEQRR